MIIVTGGAGLIGSNIVRALNRAGRGDIVVVDNLKNGHKFVNLLGCDVFDYMDKNEFLMLISSEIEVDHFIEAVFHQGACSSTTEWNGRYMMENNYTYSKAVLHYCLDRRIPLMYASSAAVYGNNTVFLEDVAHENPLNVYGYSKFQFDQYVRRLMPEAESQVVGLRYFNVYGHGEAHKGSMASVAFHLYKQLKEGKSVKLFEGTDGYGHGEQRRDFVSVEDIAAVNLWFWENKDESGIFNVGTGRAQTFNDVARAVISWFGRGEIDYIPFPEHLKGHYQSFTQADISGLREVGYDAPFKTVETGVHRYLDLLEGKG